jgi:hypothetical protein
MIIPHIFQFNSAIVFLVFAATLEPELVDWLGECFIVIEEDEED